VGARRILLAPGLTGEGGMLTVDMVEVRLPSFLLYSVWVSTYPTTGLHSSGTLWKVTPFLRLTPVLRDTMERGKVGVEMPSGCDREPMHKYWRRMSV
jgi:hypothetical protein